MKSRDPVFTTSSPKNINEGWGLTHNPQTPDRLYWSDGSSYIYTISIPEKGVTPTVYSSFKVVDTNGYPLNQLNELEFIDGYIWANVYLTNRIVKIDVTTGKVVRSYDLSTLEADANDQMRQKFGRNLYYGECLNGIAYDPSEKVWFVTGKNWPRVYVLKFN